MLKSLRSLWGKPAEVCGDKENHAQQLYAEIEMLEEQLERNPRNSEAQKQLMLTYNRALNVFASSLHYRSQIDTLFERIDKLRNLIRHNI